MQYTADLSMVFYSSKVNALKKKYENKFLWKKQYFVKKWYSKWNGVQNVTLKKIDKREQTNIEPYKSFQNYTYDVWGMS